MKKEKILLLSPTKGLSIGIPKKPKFQTHPIGLLYIASVLAQGNYEVRILDAYSCGYSIKEIEREIKSFCPDIVGITAMTIVANDAYVAAKSVRKVRPETIIIMGGPHATALPNEVLNTGYFNYVVVGEGEYAMIELCDTIGNGGGISKIRGIAYKSGEKIIKTPAREKIKELDQIPFPSYELLPLMKDYEPPPHWGQKGSFASIITSRGCPYGCYFCGVTKIWGKKYRYRSVKNVLKEIEFLYNKYNVRYLSFRDSTFTLNKKRTIEICKAIIEKEIRIHWNCNARINEVDKDVLLWMKKAGCEMIMYGIESGSEKILKKFKNITKERISEAIKMTYEAGIASHGYFMFGLPGETHKTMKETIDFAKELKLDEAGFTTVTPFPGTDLWEYLSERDLIKTKEWNKYDLKGITTFEHPNLDGEEIWKAQKKAFRAFYFRPRIIYRVLRNVRTFYRLMGYFREGLINIKK